MIKLAGSPEGDEEDSIADSQEHTRPTQKSKTQTHVHELSKKSVKDMKALREVFKKNLEEVVSQRGKDTH